MHARYQPEFKGHIVLIGPIGSGNTTIAEIVAEKLGIELLDRDLQDRHLRALGWTEEEQSRISSGKGVAASLEYLARFSVPLLERLADSVRRQSLLDQNGLWAKRCLPVKGRRQELVSCPRNSLNNSCRFAH